MTSDEIKLTPAEKRLVDALKRGKELHRIKYSRKYGVFSGRKSHGNPVADDSFNAKTVMNLRRKNVIGIIKNKSRSMLGLL